MHDFMLNTVITTAFVLIIMLDIFGICYWTSTFVNWVKKKIRKDADRESNVTE